MNRFTFPYLIYRMATNKPYRDYLIHSQDKDKEAIEYLRCAIADGDENYLALALRNIAEARCGNWSEAIARILLKLPL